MPYSKNFLISSYKSFIQEIIDIVLCRISPQKGIWLYEEMIFYLRFHESKTLESIYSILRNAYWLEEEDIRQHIRMEISKYSIYLANTYYSLKTCKTMIVYSVIRFLKQQKIFSYTKHSPYIYPHILDINNASIENHETRDYNIGLDFLLKKNVSLENYLFYLRNLLLLNLNDLSSILDLSDRQVKRLIKNIQGDSICT